MTTQPPNDRSLNERKNDPQKVVLGTLHRPTLDGSEADIVLKSLEYIGSYNWDKSPNPTIIVPGSPRIWAGKMPLTVPLDDGTHYIDQNAHRMKSFPLLPLVKAVQNTTPHFKWPPVHFVANRGSLHAMLKWAAGGFEKWEIDTQLVGKNTILLSGCPSVTIRTGKSKHSYGSNFEKGSTTPASGLEDAPSHRRIVTYDFYGLKMVVCFEVDARLPYDTNSTPPSGNPTADKTVRKEDPLVVIRDKSAQVLQTDLLKIKSSRDKKTNQKTKAVRKAKTGPKIKWKDTYHQLYFSGTQHMYRGRHEDGTFTKVQEYRFEKIRPSEERRAEIRRLRILLGEIQSLVLKHGTTRISLVCDGSGSLKAYQRRQGEDCLPEDVLTSLVV